MKPLTVTASPAIASDRRWLAAPVADLQQGLQLQHTFRSVRNGELERVLNLVTLQAQERAASARYRLHGLLTPLAFLGRGTQTWTSLTDLLRDEPSSAGYAADFFADFRYELLVPTRVEALSGHPNYYQLYYERLPAQPDILSGTLSRDPWGGQHYPYVVSRPVDLGERVIAGLPVPLPVTFLAMRLCGPEATREFTPPAAWQPTSADPDPASARGFRTDAIDRNRPGIRSLLVQQLKPAGWEKMSDAAFAEWVLDTLIPLWAAYDLAFNVATVTLNLPFLRRSLGWEPAGATLTTLSEGDEIRGPLVYYAAEEGVLREVKPVRYAYERAVRLPDTVANRMQLASLAYGYQVIGSELHVPFRFSWEPLSQLSLRAFSAYQETAPADRVSGQPAWAWTDASTGQVSWRDVLEPGVIQEGEGFDVPYVHDAHYVFNRVTHYVGPDLSHYNTLRAFRRVSPQTRLTTPRTAFTPR